MDNRDVIEILARLFVINAKALPNAASPIPPLIKSMGLAFSAPLGGFADYGCAAFLSISDAMDVS